MKGIVSFLLLLAVSILVTTTTSTIKDRCMEMCEHSHSHCEVSCDYKAKLAGLAVEVFVDGVKVSQDEAMYDQFAVNSVSFDRNFYNTPHAFTEIVNLQGVLLQKFYHAASTKFVTNGRKYAQGTMCHLLKVPIPLTESQFNNQEFMNKLFNVVPQESYEFLPASRVPMSEVYMDFLYNIRVDPAVLHGAPKNSQQENHIKQTEGHMQIVLNEYLQLAERCHESYQVHLAKHGLSPISYTLEEYTPANSNCLKSNTKLELHSKLTRELSEYIANLNVYNQLFAAIGRLKSPNRDWVYSRDEIQKFTTLQRQNEQRGVNSGEEYDINVEIPMREMKLFGGDSKLNAHVKFSGLAWKEVAVHPSDAWFDISAIHRYKSNPMNNPKNYFGMHGRLNRIPTHMVIAYKPEMRLKINRSMKQHFETNMSMLKPLEAGPFVFTTVNINTVEKNSANEEYEVVFSTNLKDPQIIALKSHSIVHVPAYMHNVNKLVTIHSSKSTVVAWQFLEMGMSFFTWGRNRELLAQYSPNGVPYPLTDRFKFFIKNAGEGQVSIVNPQGASIRVEQAGNNAPVYIKTQPTRFVGDIQDSEKFIMEKHGGQWAFKSIHGNYIKISGEMEFVTSLTLDQNALFTINIHPDQSYFKYFDRMITLKASNGGFMKAMPGDQVPVHSQGIVDPSTIWRMEYAGDFNSVVLVSSFGTYMKQIMGETLVTTSQFGQGCTFMLRHEGENVFTLGGFMPIIYNNGRFTTVSRDTMHVKTKFSITVYE